MKKKFLRRIGAIAAATALSVSALALFAGCSTDHPEVTITYSFNGKDYAVDYVLSRLDAPKTVQHFIELADAGFYDGLCVHDYSTAFLRTGGYTIENGELVEVNYLKKVKDLEEEKGISFTQSVFTADEARVPLYTVYGEYPANGNYTQNGRENRHTAGALVMYYTDKGSFSGDVVVTRNDGGKDADGEAEQLAQYKYNSITSLFYTFTGESGTFEEQNYAIIGKAKNYTEQFQNGIMAAIADYAAALEEGVSFTQEIVRDLNAYDYFPEVQRAGLDNEDDPFNTPVEMPVIVKSVKVTKY